MPRKFLAALASAALLTGALAVTTSPADAAGIKPPNVTAANTAKAPGGIKAPKGRPPAEPGSGGVTALSLCPNPNPCYFYVTGQQAATNGGAQANMLVSNPTTVSPDSHSLGEIAVQTSGAVSTSDIVEIGWTVDNTIWPGSGLPHLFVYWWDAGVSQCYNGCGWVDYVPNTLNVGAVLTTNQAATMRWQYDNPTGVAGAGKWWGWVDPDGPSGATAGNFIGYYPESQWGVFGTSGFAQTFGEVAAGSTAPCTNMGRNGFPGSGAGSAAYMGSWSLVNSATAAALSYPTPTNSTYYSESLLSNRTFYFGGGGAC